jgi:hypothetical protein
MFDPAELAQPGTVTMAPAGSGAPLEIVVDTVPDPTYTVTVPPVSVSELEPGGTNVTLVGAVPIGTCPVLITWCSR